MNIGVVRAIASDPGGYADAAAQDAFCANTYCWISIIYDQSPKHNDLTQAPRIVSVGRGIKGEEHVQLARDLAASLGAELAASRPIIDAGWLPSDRQVGSSGQTVAPRLYLALGISGAIQHVVGMKGAGTIVAINKDPDAPIFEIADYGIVGDLFEIVPAMIAELKKA
jgi:electron transfer flavoprotein alpha subunit